jgi:hypothetical protein
MGRKKLNRTKEELLGQHKERQRRYYYKNREEINKLRMQKYWKDKNN